MKLRNKHTGEIKTITEVIHEAYAKHELESLAKLNAEWEDYKPKEPLIKDEEIRKVVRAWAEVNGLTDIYYDTNWKAFRRYTFTISFDYDFDEHDGLVDKKYTITELCGEGE